MNPVANRPRERAATGPANSPTNGAANGTVHAQHARHVPVLVSPWFAAAGEGSTLHHYDEDAFVPRFLGDAASGRLSGTAAQSWYRQDRFGRWQDAPTLRLPMHRSFYIAACELACSVPGQPAYDPRKVVSGGLVIRRLVNGQAPQRWMLADGRALGWVPLSGEQAIDPDAEPDLARRLQQRGLLPRRTPEPAATGEAVAPMHTLLVRRRDAQGVERSHTLLWGYVPLSGSARETAEATVPGVAEGGPDFGAELAWPLGTQGARAWQPGDGLLVRQGVGSAALADWVEMLLVRHRITDARDDDNTGLRNLLAQIRFVPYESNRRPQDYAGVPDSARGESVLAWLARSADALQAWLSQVASGSLSASNSRLPAGAAPGQRNDDLYLSESQASGLRQLLVLRSARATARSEVGLQLPRFGPGDDQRFILQPFVRWLDDCGCERISWGPASLPFRVAAPLDPQAQRPTTVVLPSLSDLKRGMPNGLTLLAPQSLANVLRKIKPAMPPEAGGPGNRAGVCWSFSFSLPVITICAMVLLMVIVSLLNLLFFWLPWAMLSLPRLCIKALKE